MYLIIHEKKFVFVMMLVECCRPVFRVRDNKLLITERNCMKIVEKNRM